MSVLTAISAQEGLEVLQSDQVDVALVDLQMPGLTGMEMLKQITEQNIDVHVVIMTAHGDVDVAVQAMHAGAYHFLTKPFRSADEVALTIYKAVEHRRLRDRNVALERRLQRTEKFGDLIGSSQKMHSVYERATGVAGTSSTVLIVGESGTGKELTARAIHARSTRSNNRFVAVNCSAIPENLIESELFGHVRGAFTGATATRQGLFENADGGTLFLDEIGDLPPLAQVKVLRALQEGEVRRVGSDETRNVDVRVITATNVDLRDRINSGLFHFPASPERFEQVVAAMGIDLRGMTSSAKKNALLEKVREIKRAAGLDLVLNRLGVRRSDLPLLSANALRDPCMMTNPRRPNRRDIEVIYEESL
jgi:DNA-binding NtrC family response regulator